MNKPFDIILWGATGYTGQLVAEYLVRHADSAVRWAIAGRNQAKLEKVREALTAVSPTAAALPILLGDSQDRASMDAIVAQTRVVCSTVGPYALYGTPLVASCAAQGVDYCDLTGETLWMRQNIDAFHTQAEQTGARIVHCCGYDCIPSDLGVLTLQEHALAVYGRFCTEIQMVMWGASGGFSGGTAASMLNMLEQVQNDKDKARLLANPYNLVPEREPDWSQVDQADARFDEALQVWTGPFVMAGINTRIVRRSHALLEWRYGENFRYNESMRMPNRAAAVGFSSGFKVGMGLTTVPQIRSLLADKMLPAPGEGPSAESRESGYFRNRLVGKIPVPELVEGTLPELAEGEITILGTVGDNLDPGYGSTAKMLGESALCLAFDDLPRRGGILTPASALGMTLVNRLRQAGMTFKPETLETL
jgi:short subunit dehydrogenase-like uncharacterized protein